VSVQFHPSLRPTPLFVCGKLPKKEQGRIPIRALIRRPGSNAKTLGEKRKTDLTLTGHLMDGLGIQTVRQMIVLELAIVVEVETLRDSSAQSSVAATNSQQQVTPLHFYS